MHTYTHTHIHTHIHTWHYHTQTFVTEVMHRPLWIVLECVTKVEE